MAKARPLGWDKAQTNNQQQHPDPSIPTFEGVPEWLEGDIKSWKTPTGVTKYQINGIDIDPATIQD